MATGVLESMTKSHLQPACVKTTVLLHLLLLLASNNRCVWNNPYKCRIKKKRLLCVLNINKKKQ